MRIMTLMITIKEIETVHQIDLKNQDLALVLKVDRVDHQTKE